MRSVSSQTVDPGLVALARALYRHYTENPPWVPHEFSPKKFKLAQLCTLVDILEISSSAFGLADLVKQDAPGTLKIIEQLDDRRGLIDLLRVAPIFVRIGPLNHRRLAQLLAASPELKTALELARAPHYSTIAKLEARLKAHREEQAGR